MRKILVHDERRQRTPYLARVDPASVWYEQIVQGAAVGWRRPGQHHHRTVDRRHSGGEGKPSTRRRRRSHARRGLMTSYHGSSERPPHAFHVLHRVSNIL